MRPAIVTIICCFAILCGGCKHQAKERKYRAVAVTATHIDAESGVVAVKWKDQRTDQAETRTGRVTIETEIFINGISASLEDIRIGDQAIVIAYPTVTSDVEQWIVTRVSVNREESYMLSKPAPTKQQTKP